MNGVYNVSSGEIIDEPGPGGGRPGPEDNSREAILARARLCVCGDRDQTYGGPEDSFREIAGAWAWYLKTKCCTGGVELLPEDVAAMMCLFKLARIKTAQTYSRDSWVDLCGYGACGGEIAGK